MAGGMVEWWKGEWLLPIVVLPHVLEHLVQNSGMAEWQKEWRNGGMAERMEEWQKLDKK